MKKIQHQIIFIGLDNAGKSQIVELITHGVSLDDIPSAVYSPTCGLIEK